MEVIVDKPITYNNTFYGKDVVIYIESYTQMAATTAEFVSNKNDLNSLKVKLKAGIPNANIIYGYLNDHNIPVDIINDEIVNIETVNDDFGTADSSTVEVDYKTTLIKRLKNIFSREKK